MKCRTSSAVLVAFCSACTGTIGDATSAAPSAMEASATCSPSAVVTSAAPRLTSRQYQLTLEDLFTGFDLPALSTLADVTVDHFDNNVDGQVASSSLFEAYQTNAETISGALVPRLGELMGCAPTSVSEESACVASFIARFGARVFRRPLSAEEQARLAALFTTVRATDSFVNASRSVIEGFLQSPLFVYRIEHGEPIDGDSRMKLRGTEVANRMAYFLTDSAPDEELASAAAAGLLDEPDGIAEQTRRLLDEPRARDVVARFHREWLHLDAIDTVTKDATAYPGFDATTAVAIRQSAEGFVDANFWNGGGLHGLLTDTHAPVDAKLAPVFGLSAGDFGDTQEWVDTNPAQRSGILTHPGLMAAFAHLVSDSPVTRGVFVLDRFLCAPPPPAPPDVNIALADSPPNTVQTTRQRLEQSHVNGACSSCHKRIDGVGFGFEHYDGIGAYRTTDAGMSVDASGELTGTDVDGPFDGALELAQRLDGSAQVSACVATEWYRFALGVSRNDMTSCAAQPVVRAFEASRGDLVGLVVALTTSDSFRYRESEVLQ